MIDDPDLLIAQLAHDRGLLTQQQLKECLILKAEFHTKGLEMSLSEVMVRRGYVDDDFLKSAEEIEKQETQARKKEGATLGEFQILSKIGEGAHASVYVAYQPSTKRTAALKVLWPRLAADDEYVARFQRETEASMKLDHPHIVHAYASGMDRGFHYLAMEYVEGETLAEGLDRGEILIEEDAIGLTRKLADALDHIHQNDLVHRDIKPENVLIGKDGSIKLTDLGLAIESAKVVTRITQTGQIIGTPLYMSPEQARGIDNLDIRSDIYSLGATLYNCVTGVPPFQGDKLISTMTKRIIEDAKDPREHNPEVSEGYARILLKMLARPLKRRYQTPRELVKAIDALIEARERGEDEPASARTRAGRNRLAMTQSIRRRGRRGMSYRHLTARRRSNRKALVGVIALALAVGIGGFSVMTYMKSHLGTKRPAKSTRPTRVARAPKPKPTKPRPLPRVAVQPKPAKPKPLPRVAVKPQPAKPRPPAPVSVKPQPAKPKPLPRVAAKPQPAKPKPLPRVAAKPQPAKPKPLEPATVEPAAPPHIGTGDGLSAWYYIKGANGSAASGRVDQIDFDWGIESPHRVLPADGFKVTWGGYVLAQYDEEYTFIVEVNDGAKLKIDGKLIVNGWKYSKKDQTLPGTAILRAGSYHKIDLRMIEGKGEALARLYWSSKSTPKQIVPGTQLYTEPPKK